MVCYYEHYYTLNSDLADKNFRLNEYNELFIETNVLRELEGKYPNLYKVLANSKKLPFPHAIDLVDFIIQMKLRNPYLLEHTLEKHKNEWIESTMNEIYHEFLKDRRFAKIPTEIKKGVHEHIRQNNKEDVSFAKKIQLYGLIQRYSQKDERNIILREALIKNEWFLLKTPNDGPYFITSDNPGFSTNPNNNLIYNTRFAGGFIFHFPVSPKLCLLVTDTCKTKKVDSNNQDKNITHLNIDPNTVIRINNGSLHCINKILIGSEKWYLNEIANNNKG